MKKATAKKIAKKVVKAIKKKGGVVKLKKKTMPVKKVAKKKYA